MSTKIQDSCWVVDEVSSELSNLGSCELNFTALVVGPKTFDQRREASIPYCPLIAVMYGNVVGA